MHGLAAALEGTPHQFALDLGMLAARSGHLDLQVWLQDCLDKRGISFCQVCPAHHGIRLARIVARLANMRGVIMLTLPL